MTLFLPETDGSCFLFVSYSKQTRRNGVKWISGSEQSSSHPSRQFQLTALYTLERQGRKSEVGKSVRALIAITFAQGKQTWSSVLDPTFDSQLHAPTTLF